MPQLISALSDFPRRFENTVHCPDRAQIPAFIEESRVNRRRSFVHETIFVKHLKNLVPFVVAERAGQLSLALHLPLRLLDAPTSPVEGGSRNLKGTTRSRFSRLRRELLTGNHPFSSSLSGTVGSPRTSQSFFWTSIIFSACRSLFCRCSLSRRKCSFSTSSGSRVFALRPRFLDASPVNWPCSRCRRHAANADEYSPSRRKSAAIPPGPHVSASSRMRNLYSAVWRLRIGLAGTSGSGTG